LENKEYLMTDDMRFEDKSNDIPPITGPMLRGVINIKRHNKITGEEIDCGTHTNIIPISGYQWILMKMFGLFLDSSHGKVTDDLTRDTTLAIPDLNEKLFIGVNPAGQSETDLRSINGYTIMEDDIAVNHICQGFMIGIGGAGEDNVTTKNTAYHYISLRHPIPFQQSLDGSMTDAGKYLGLYFGNDTSEASIMSKSAYIKKFDSTPHIYHSWWVDGQRWNYVDPVTPMDLGPNAIAGVPKTDRIETYVECKLSLSDTDCHAYFEKAGTATAMINELGLVAFDTVQGTRSMVETLYEKTIQRLLMIIYKNKGDIKSTEAENTIAIYLIKQIKEALNDLSVAVSPHIGNMWAILPEIPNGTIGNGCIIYDKPEDETISSSGSSTLGLIMEELDDNRVKFTLDYEYLKNQLAAEDCIQAQAFYNQNDTLQYVEDKFVHYLESSETDGLTLDEAQRIKLITYYTFNSIPISKNWEILINYRIYAN